MANNAKLGNVEVASVETGNIKGVLFDLDGTLLDTHDLILASFRHATRKVLGLCIPDEELLKKVGQPLDTQMWDFADNAETHELLLTTYRAHNHAIHDDRVKAFAGVPEMLAQLQAASVKMGVVTSKRLALAARGLEVCGLADMMECLVAPDDFPEHKPAPGPVLHGCKLLGVQPSECIYVGDSPYDIQAGNAAGCPTVAVTWGMFDRALLEEQSPTCAISLPDELPLLLS